MTRNELQAHTRKELAALARDNGVVGWHGMSKEDLVLALVKKPAIARTRGNGTAKMDKVAHNGSHPVRPARVALPVQAAVARNTSGSPSPEEQIESSKFDVGVADPRPLRQGAPRPAHRLRQGPHVSSWSAILTGCTATGS